MKMLEASVFIILGGVISGLITYFLKGYPVLKFLPGVLFLGFGIYLGLRFRNSSILMNEGAYGITGYFLIIISVFALLTALFVKGK